MRLSLSFENAYHWQKDCYDSVKGRNAVISAPTGSGKTLVAYMWAGLSELLETGSMKFDRIIFTAPIKALSNERYMDLSNMGFRVGIETGDFKKNENADIVCCTQEIYTLKYASLPNQAVVVDEFHYIFTEPSRARMYAKGMSETHPTSKVLVMSATFGSPSEVSSYLSKIMKRKFELYVSSWRPTELVFKKKPVSPQHVQNALCFVFSSKGAEFVANTIASSRKKSGCFDYETVRSISDELDIHPKSLNWENMKKGVGTYYGAMLPKEKLFYETIYRKGYIDVMVGTDALSLGVNLPAENVYFCQLAKYYEGPIGKNAFLQMAGRAGRKKFYDVGYAGIVSGFGFAVENREYCTKTLYKKLLAASPENASVRMDPSYGEILRGETTVEKEIEFIENNSFPSGVDRTIRDTIKRTMRRIKRESSIYREQFGPYFDEILAEFWYDENLLETNMNLAVYIATRASSPEKLKNFSMENIREIYETNEKNRNELQTLLRIVRFTNNVKLRLKNRKGYLSDIMRQMNLESIYAQINRMDSSVFNFEDKIKRVDSIG